MGGLIQGVGKAAGDVGNAIGGAVRGVGDFLSGPKPPDFQALAQQQATQGQAAVNQQTQANRPDQNGQFGSTNWVQGPDGQWTQNTSFGAGVQPSVDLAQQQLANQLRQGLPTGQEARDQAINASYGQATSRLDPMFAQREEQMRAQLANQGLDPTSEAYQNATANFGRERNDAYGSAMNSAIGQGQQAGESIFRQGLLGQQGSLGLLGGFQNLTNGQPGFNAAGNAGGPDLLGAAGMQGSADLQRWKQQMGLLGDIGQAGVQAAVMKSDERLKRDIVREAEEALPGVPWASWSWRDAPGPRARGVIAQDLMRVAPELVLVGNDGMLMVDYGGLTARRERANA